MEDNPSDLTIINFRPQPTLVRTAALFVALLFIPIPLFEAPDLVPVVVIQPQAQASHEVGMNLDFFTSYSRQLIFTDAFKRARTWIPNNATDWDWDSGESIPLRADGYPLEIPYDPDGAGGVEPQEVKTLFLDNLDGHYQAGVWNFSFEGTGFVELDWDHSGNFSDGGPHSIDISSPWSGLLLRITRSNASDPIRNITFSMPGAGPSDVFNPLFIDIVANFSSVRHMNVMNTNNVPCDNGISRRDPACIMEWANRSRMDHYTQGQNHGIALEYLVDMSNAAAVDPWFTFGHACDDDYFFRAAQLIHSRLDPGLQVYIELSNEVWNGIFDQSHYFWNSGEDLGLHGDRYEAGRIYFVNRTIRMFEQFERVFEPGRVVKVLPSQAGNSWLSGNLLSQTTNPAVNPNNTSTDALAIAPYFGGGIGDQIGDNGWIDNITVPEILDWMHESVYSQTENYTMDNKVHADNYGVDLIAYEGGQHLVAYWPYDSNTTMTQKLTDTNRDPRTYDIYHDMLDVWFDNGGGFFAAFQLVSGYGRYGSWGSMEWLGQPIEDTHKYRALVEVAINETVDVSDQTPPTIPTGLTATVLSSTSIQLDWMHSTDPQTWVSHYTLYRDGTAVTNITGNAYNDATLQPYTNYTYTLTATNPHGSTSDQSQPATVRTLYQDNDSIPPTMIDLIVASSSEIHVHFDEPIEPASLEPSDFVISPNTTILSVQQPELDQVVLQTEEHPPGTYSLFVTSLTDLADNEITPQAQTYDIDGIEETSDLAGLSSFLSVIGIVIVALIIGLALYFGIRRSRS